MKNIEISLNFMPAFYNKHIGLKYGEAYYFDPDYRVQIERQENKYLYEILGRYGVGSPNPEPSVVVSVQPVDLVLKTQGAQWRFPDDAVLESIGTPWGKLSKDEIEKIDPKNASYHPVMDSLLNQYKELERTLGDKADIFWAKSGYMLIHTPYTTAHQLCGEELFIDMYEDPEKTTIIFDKIWQIYQAIFSRISEVTRTRFDKIHLGDCSASLLSEELYRKMVLPVNSQIISGFESAGYHSCGSSSHLISAFAELPKVDSIQLGFGTDFAKSVDIMKNCHIQPIMDSSKVLMDDADIVSKTTQTIIKDTANASKVTLLAWAFDRDTPIENVEAIYKVIN